MESTSGRQAAANSGGKTLRGAEQNF